MPQTTQNIILEGLALTALVLLGPLGVGIFTWVQVGLIGGSIGLNILLNKPKDIGRVPGGPDLPPPEAGHQPVKQDIPPRIVGYGHSVRLAGAYVLFDAKDKISYDVIAFHHGKIGAIVGYYLHDDVVTINGSGVVDVHGDGRYGSSAITIKTRLGLVPETAYPEISTPLSTIWGSNYRGDGLASLALICNQLATPSEYANTYPRGLPLPSVVCDTTPIFDKRDTTQSIGDTGTHKVSSNPIIQLMDFLTNSDRGMGFDYATLIAPALTKLLGEADYCDQLIAKAGGGVERRYESHGSFPLDSDPADVISTILDTFDGWIGQNGDGSLAIWSGVYRAPTVELESRHIRGYNLQYDVAEEEEVNELTIDYTEPLLDYKTAPGDPWRNETAISERGKVLSQRLALPWVYSHSQARRLAKRRDNQNNAILRGVLTTTLYGIRCLGERWIQITAPDLPDLENIVIEVRGMTVDLLNANCQIKFVSVNPNVIDAWDPAIEEGSAPTIPSKLVYPLPPIPQNPSAVALLTGVINGKFSVSFDDPGRPDLNYEVHWRINGSGGSFTSDTRSTGTLSGGRVTIAHAGFLAINGNTYEVQVRSFAPTGAGSAYSISCTVAI